MLIHLLQIVLDGGGGGGCRTVIITGRCVVITQIVAGFESRCVLVQSALLLGSNAKLFAHVRNSSCTEWTKSHVPYGFVLIGAS
jgi:hypothetical protein